MQNFFSPWVFLFWMKKNFFKFLSQNFFAKVFLPWVFLFWMKKIFFKFYLKTFPVKFCLIKLFSLSLKNFSKKYLAENDKKITKKGNINVVWNRSYGRQLTGDHKLAYPEKPHSNSFDTRPWILGNAGNNFLPVIIFVANMPYPFSFFFHDFVHVSRLVKYFEFWNLHGTQFSENTYQKLHLWSFIFRQQKSKGLWNFQLQNCDLDSWCVC